MKEELVPNSKDTNLKIMWVDPDSFILFCKGRKRKKFKFKRQKGFSCSGCKYRIATFSGWEYPCSRIFCSTRFHSLMNVCTLLSNESVLGDEFIVVEK